jgi:hypothetical protein
MEANNVLFIQVKQEEIKFNNKDSNYPNNYDLNECQKEALDELSRINKSQNISFLISLFSLLIFFIMLAIKVENLTKDDKPKKNQYLFIYLLIPAYMAIIAITIYSNYLIRMKDLAEHIENGTKANSKGFSLGNVLFYVCLNISCACFLIYITLLAIKLDNFNVLLHIQFNVISIPFYILLGIVIFFFIFTIPAIIYSKLYFVMCVLSLYIISLFISFLLINLKADGNLKSSFMIILSPLFVAFITHIIYSIHKMIEEFDETFKYNLFHTLGLILILTGTIFVSLNADQSTTRNSFPVILYLFSILCFIDYNIFSCKEDDNK